MPENDTVAASLQTSPFALVTGGNVRRIGGYSVESDGAHAGTDWLSAGAGLRFELANGVAFLTDYEGVFFRSNAAQHYASAKVSYEWGAILPNGMGEENPGKNVVAAYEPLPYGQPGQQVAETNEPAAAGQAEEKKSTGGRVGWLNKKSHNPEVAEATKAVASPAASAESKGKGSNKVEPIADEAGVGQVSTKPAATPMPSSSSQEGVVVYKTWDEVPGLKKKEAAAAAKAAEPEDEPGS